jgi:hypothetical protein
MLVNIRGKFNDWKLVIPLCAAIEFEKGGEEAEGSRG